MISFILGLFFKKIFQGKTMLWKILFESLSVFFTVSIVYYASESYMLKMVAENQESQSLFVFLLVGEIALVLPMSFAERIIHHFMEIRHQQFYQTLIGLRISPLKYVLSKAFVDILFPFIRLNLILFFSYLVLNFHFSLLSLLGFYLLQIFAVLLFMAMGLITTLIYLKFNRGIGFFYTLQSFAAIIGGAYFPITIFPLFLKNFSILLPQTQLLSASRLILQGLPVTFDIYWSILIWILLLSILWFLLDKYLETSLKHKARYF